MSVTLNKSPDLTDEISQFQVTHKGRTTLPKARSSLQYSTIAQQVVVGRDSYVRQLLLNILKMSQEIILSGIADVSWTLNRISSRVLQVSRLSACQVALEKLN